MARLSVLKTAVAFILAAVLFLAVFLCISWNEKNNLEVSFLDVGQGDATLVETPAGQNILIDGGPDDKVIRELSREMDWWDRKIDLMVLTHPHDDHVSGLINVLKRYEVGKIMHPGIHVETPVYKKWLRLARDKNIPLVKVNSPQLINLSKDCKFKVIYPDKNLNEKENLNNTSVVAKLIYNKTSYLFTGDIEKEVEKYLLEKRYKLKSDILKASHHGSDTSNSLEFLKRVNPKVMIISAGQDNDLGHPSLRVLKRARRLGIQIFRTDEDGTIKINSNGQKVWTY